MIIALLSLSVAANPAFPLDTMKIRESSLNHTFGMVRNNGSRAHQGWDLEANIGDKVYAICDYKHISSGFSKDYGYWVQYQSTKSGYIYFNAHLSSFGSLKPDKRGTVVGYVGRTGNARNVSTTHLHFEMRTRWRPGFGLVGRVSPARTFGSWKLYIRGGVNDPF